MTPPPPSRLRRLQLGARAIKTSTYEISATCNLTCEGCLFFSGEHAYKHTEVSDSERWRKFFQREAERGITYAFLAGAEPALAIDRVRAAAEYIPAGMIATNGTRRIPDDVRYRIHVSLWGGEATTALTRGADVTAKAFRNYAHDPRAVFVFTINAMNLDEIRPMAYACAKHGVPMTFNYFAPTEVYETSISVDQPSRDDYLRFSDQDRNLILCDEDYARARTIIDGLRDELPETIVYSSAYDDWITSESPYDLDEAGIARDCASRSDSVHQTYFVDQARSDLKCSHPTFDCRQCRTYASGMTSHVRNENRDVMRRRGRQSSSDAFDVWERLFVGDQWTRLSAHSDVIRQMD